MQLTSSHVLIKELKYRLYIIISCCFTSLFLLFFFDFSFFDQFITFFNLIIYDNNYTTPNYTNYSNYKDTINFFFFYPEQELNYDIKYMLIDSYTYIFIYIILILLPLITYNIFIFIKPGFYLHESYFFKRLVRIISFYFLFYLTVNFLLISFAIIYMDIFFKNNNNNLYINYNMSSIVYNYKSTTLSLMLIALIFFFYIIYSKIGPLNYSHIIVNNYFRFFMLVVTFYLLINLLPNNILIMLTMVTIINNEMIFYNFIKNHFIVY